VNDAEIIYRPAYPEPWAWPGTDMWVVQNRAHAIHNTCYCIAPNLGAYHAAPWLVDPHYTAPLNSGGARSMIIDYTGRILHECASAGDGYAAAVINIEALREFRINSKFSNGMLDLRVEQYMLIYDALMSMGGIHPKNLAMKEPPKRHAETDAIFAKVVEKLVDLCIWTRPERDQLRR
jgi:hypothetical protein